MRSPRACALQLGLTLIVATACQDEPKSFRVADNDFREFKEEVLPVMLRDCGFHTCHGAGERFFRVYGPGRARLNPATRAFDLPSGDEVELSYRLALSMIDAEHPAESLLLRKPLAVEAGGAAHLGADAFGRNVYRTVNDSGYLVLARWVLGPSVATP
jgi:hypothetical protein